MENSLPEMESFVRCFDCYERWPLIRNLILETFGPEFVNTFHKLKKHGPDGFQKLVESGDEFYADKDLRNATIDVILAATLWVEADRSPQEILDNCAPEIKDHMVQATNVFYKWIEVKSVIQQEEHIAQGSLATAWIYLFGEFRKDTDSDQRPWWWEPQPVPFSWD